jgi:hypothetical protein
MAIPHHSFITCVFGSPTIAVSAVFTIKTTFQSTPTDETTSPPNLARSDIKSKLTHDPNATSRQNLVNPNLHLNRKSSMAGEQVSAHQRHSLCTRRTRDRAITCEAAPKPRHRSRRENIPSARATKPTAAPTRADPRRPAPTPRPR